MAIKYQDGSLFDIAPQGACLAHSCNTMGSWGAGIAKQFKDKYPKDYLEYYKVCMAFGECREKFLGGALITYSNIACLFTSLGYGNCVSNPDDIIKYTEQSLHILSRSLPPGEFIYSPKINSGLFNVPWERTEQLIEDFLTKRPDLVWTVCTI